MSANWKGSVDIGGSVIEYSEYIGRGENEQILEVSMSACGWGQTFN